MLTLEELSSMGTSDNAINTVDHISFQDDFQRQTNIH